MCRTLPPASRPADIAIPAPAQRMVAGELKSLYEVALFAIGLPTTPALYPIPAPDTSASANSPYIIGFHGAFIDINFGAVCLALEVC